MKSLRFRWSVLAFVVCTLTFLLSGCVLTGGGYYDGGYYDGGGYYEPSGVEYGGWGPGYQVAPFRGGDHSQHESRGDGRSSSRSFRSAPASREVPSIPSHSGSGASRSGSGGSRSDHGGKR